MNDKKTSLNTAQQITENSDQFTQYGGTQHFKQMPILQLPATISHSR